MITTRMLIYGDGDTLDALIVRLWVTQPEFMESERGRFVRGLAKRCSSPYETDMLDYQRTNGWIAHDNLMEARVAAQEMGLSYEFHVYDGEGETLHRLDSARSQGWLNGPWGFNRLTGDQSWDAAATFAL